MPHFTNLKLSHVSERTGCCSTASSSIQDDLERFRFRLYCKQTYCLTLSAMLLEFVRGLEYGMALRSLVVAFDELHASNATVATTRDSRRRSG